MAEGVGIEFVGSTKRINPLAGCELVVADGVKNDGVGAIVGQVEAGGFGSFTFNPLRLNFRPLWAAS
tara:strand:+ start:18206 stop:18406 length:201 start_codon:yes stop_codon:yes gene_type:complete